MKRQFFTLLGMSSILCSLLVLQVPSPAQPYGAGCSDDCCGMLADGELMCSGSDLIQCQNGEEVEQGFGDVNYGDCVEMCSGHGVYPNCSDPGFYCID